MNTWIVGGILVIMLAAGAYIFLMPGEDVMVDTEDAMMEKSGDTMMETNGAPSGDADSAMMDAGEGAMDDDAMTRKGSYSDYSPDKLALASENKVVLYFHADWCPICRPLDAEMRAKESTLSGVHILKVNYDTATALKQKYGVTYQHTFVQVDAQGNMIAKWGDATSLAGVLAKVQ